MKVPRILAFLLLITSPCNIAWSAPITAYVAEFNATGGSKPEEMKTTIQNLLLSRLASEKIITINKPEGADIKITGSYLQIGTVFSLDAAAFNNSGAVIARAFTQGTSADEFIPAVGTLAKSLSAGIEKGAAKIAVTLPQTTVLPADIIKPVQTVFSAGQSVHKMDGALNGLAVGRTFPNGDRELFVVGPHVLRYYRQGAELKLLAEIPYKVYETVLAVDTANLDNDTTPEIYVTILKGETLASQVLKVDGTSLKQIAGPLPYFFRAVTSAGNVKKLYAQQISGAEDFYGDVSEVIKSGNNYQFINPVKMPKLGYLYNFNILKGSNGVPATIIADRSGYLRVFTVAGEEIWKSSEEYGGSENSFKRIDSDSSRTNNGYRRVFLDQRMIMKANGELLVLKNSSSWYMISKHSYSRNSMYCFVWNGADLEEKWHTKQSDNYLADFAYDDATRELLMLEVIDKQEGIFDKGSSRLVIRKVD